MIPRAQKMDEVLDILILGCGYTGQRVAKRFLARGGRVTATTRNPQRLADLGAEIIATTKLSEKIRPGMLVLHSIPPSGPRDLLYSLRTKVQRMVYLSSTVVYGKAAVVDETTPVDPDTEQARERLDAERIVEEGPWSTLILRPAAIYGPGRGIQESIRRGEYSRSGRFVSRIHVDDLVAHVEAALLSNVTGTYPVADEEPCSSREIADFCMRIMNLPMSSAGRGKTGRIPRFADTRRVDGSAIRRKLGITLTYPSYRVGIPAVLACGASSIASGFRESENNS